MFPSDAGVGYADRRLGREGEGRRRRVEPGFEVRLGVAAGGAERRRRRVRAAHHAAWCRLVPVHDHGVVEEHGPELALPPELLEQHGAHGFRKGQPIAIAPGRVLLRHRAVVLPFFKRPQFFVRELPRATRQVSLEREAPLESTPDIHTRSNYRTPYFFFLPPTLRPAERRSARLSSFFAAFFFFTGAAPVAAAALPYERTRDQFRGGTVEARGGSRRALGRARRARAARRARPPPVERARARCVAITRDAGAPRPGSPGRSP